MSDYRKLTDIEKTIIGAETSADGDMKDVITFGKALLTVAGADGEVTETEMLAFWDLFAMTIDLPSSAKEELRNFDFKTGNLEELVPQIAKNNYPRLTNIYLIYGAAKISMSDGYHEKEKAAVMELGTKLGIEAQDIMKIEALAQLAVDVFKTNNMILKTM